MKRSGNENLKTNEKNEFNKLICTGCKQPVEALYQNDLCRSCLNQIFRKLVHVIDSVRKYE